MAKKKEQKNDEIVISDSRNILRLSPSSIEVLNNCEAGFIYQKLVLPKIRTTDAAEATRFGSSFHKAAEYEFSDDSISTMQHAGEITEGEIKKLSDMKSFINDLDFLKELDESEREVEIEWHLSENYLLRGIIDLLARKDDIFYIVDWKSSVIPSYDRDYRQILSYAYMLAKGKGINPSLIRLFVVYPQADEVKEYACNDVVIKTHENYLRTMFKYAEKLVKKYKSNNGDMREFTHSVGNCGLCPMKGKCVAYHITVNPSDIGDSMSSTSELISELFEKTEIMKILDERTKAIKNALLLRLDEDSPTFTEEDRDLIRNHLSVRQNTQTIVSIGEYVSKVRVPMITKCLRSDVVTSASVDTGAIATLLSGEIEKIAGSKVINAKKIDESAINKLNVEKRKGKPYISIK